MTKNGFVEEVTFNWLYEHKKKVWRSQCSISINSSTELSKTKCSLIIKVAFLAVFKKSDSIYHEFNYDTFINWENVAVWKTVLEGAISCMQSYNTYYY